MKDVSRQTRGGAGAASGLTCSRTGEERAGKTRGGVKGKKLLPLLLLLLTLVPFH